MKYWNLFGLQVQQAGYQGTVPYRFGCIHPVHIEKFVLKGTIDFIHPHSSIPYYGFLTFLLVSPDVP